MTDFPKISVVVPRRVIKPLNYLRGLERKIRRARNFLFNKTKKCHLAVEAAKYNFDISVVIITVGRDSLLRAVRSVFSQECLKWGKSPYKIQILIGVDIDLFNNIREFETVLKAECPENISLNWLNLGYSTSRRHGGVHECFYGGSLRSALTLLADSPYVTYLDDDDWFMPDHIGIMLRGFKQHPEISWGFSLCYYADGNNGTVFCIDELESVGVNQGIYANSFGGFVRPSGLLINKLKLLHLTHIWSTSLTSAGDGEDRLIFNELKHIPHLKIEHPTVCYSLDPKDRQHNVRIKFIREKTGEIELCGKLQSLR